MAKGTSRFDSVISLAKRRGFVFPSGEIYGGTRSAWDYGALRHSAWFGEAGVSGLER